MKVAILYSGGKDSTFAIQHAKEKGWDIKYLLSIKPTRKDCYCFHFATVEHTKELAEMLGIPHIFAECSSRFTWLSALFNILKSNSIERFI